MSCGREPQQTWPLARAPPRVPGWMELPVGSRSPSMSLGCFTGQAPVAVRPGQATRMWDAATGSLARQPPVIWGERDTNASPCVACVRGILRRRRRPVPRREKAALVSGNARAQFPFNDAARFYRSLRVIRESERGPFAPAPPCPLCESSRTGRMPGPERPPSPPARLPLPCTGWHPSSLWAL